MTLVASLIPATPKASREIPNLPNKYADFQDVLGEEEMAVFLPHRDCDCAIELILGAMSAKRLTSLKHYLDS